jgi:hypothetical protein
MDDLSYPTIAELEQSVADNPGDAQALVRLANGYWLEGRGPDLVGEIAERAKKLDPDSRGAWHMWSLAESNPRKRTERWRQVVEQFPADELARANLADNAAALAGAEHDYVALDLAISTYEELLKGATEPMQREAIENALEVLRKWKF